MIISKVINNNIKSHIINSNITEYNIKRAYPTILSHIDKNKYAEAAYENSFNRRNSYRPHSKRL